MENCGRDFAKRKQSDVEFAGNSLLRMVITDIIINTLLGTVTLDRAGMHCPAGDDAFVSSYLCVFNVNFVPPSPFASKSGGHDS